MKKSQAKKYKLQVPLILIKNFNDLGNEITEEFKVLYHGFFTKGKVQLTRSFIDKSKELFSNFDNQDKTVLSDRYFENFTPITEALINKGQYRGAFELWNQIIHFVKEWEDSNNKNLHKGTPYYFSAAAAMLGMDFDAALISMHLALIEDKLNHENYKETPAYYFLTLNDQKPNQYFKPFVDKMVSFLRDRIDGQGSEQGGYKEPYQRTRNGNLTYEQLRQKFLDNDNLVDEVRYFFVYSTIRFWYLRVLQESKIGDDIVAPIIFVQALGGILITIESLLKSKYPTLKYFGNLFEKLAKDENWEIPNLKQIENERDKDFDRWVDSCLNQKTLFGDFSLSYGLRNFAFHKIKSQQKLWQDYTEVLQSVWNCFFKAVEIL